jgi:hypothetical protein
MHWGSWWAGRFFNARQVAVGVLDAPVVVADHI